MMKIKPNWAIALICGSGFMVTSHVIADPAQTIVDDPSGSIPTEVEVKSAKDQIVAVTRAFDQQAKGFMKKVRAQKDRKKMMEMYRNERPSPAGAITLILKLAKESPKAEGVEKGLTWCIQRANPEQLKEIGAILLVHHKDSSSLGILAMSYGRMRQGGEAELKEIINKAGDEKVRHGATYYLASKLVKSEATKAEGLALMKKLAATPGIDQSNPQMLAQAKGQINVIENLSIGCTAPDIIGKDHDGKEFKLSDYRGKAVLVDFWGIW